MRWKNSPPRGRARHDACQRLPRSIPFGPEGSRVLGRILSAIVDLSTTPYWPEFSALLWSVIQNYRAEIKPHLQLMTTNEEVDKRTPNRL